MCPLRQAIQVRGLNQLHVRLSFSDLIEHEDWTLEVEITSFAQIIGCKQEWILTQRNKINDGQDAPIFEVYGIVSGDVDFIHMKVDVYRLTGVLA